MKKKTPPKPGRIIISLQFFWVYENILIFYQRTQQKQIKYVEIDHFAYLVFNILSLKN